MERTVRHHICAGSGVALRLPAGANGLVPLRETEQGIPPERRRETMASVYEVVLRGYAPTNEPEEETVGVFETREQAERIAAELSALWPEDREGLVPVVVEHETGRLQGNWGYILAEHAADHLIATAETSRPLSTDCLDAIIGGHGLEGAMEEAFRGAYAAFFGEGRSAVNDGDSMTAA